MKYEAMVIIGNDLNEKEAENHITDSVLASIKELKGIITFEDFWGARGFAYKIEKQTWGYYFVTQFELEPQNINELKSEWKLNKKIVRFLIAKVDPKAPAPRPYAEQKKEWDVLSAKKKEESDAPQENKKNNAKSSVKASTPITPEKSEKTDADKKLDKILENSSLDL